MHLEAYSPEHTTDDTIRAMSYYAISQATTPLVSSLARDITRGIHPSDKTSQMLAVLNYILANYQYVKDEDEAGRLFGTSGDLEMVKSPSAVIESRRYDCDCIATLIASILISLGIKPRFVVVGFDSYDVTGPDGFDHVYCMGFDDRGGKWVIVDPVSHPIEKQMELDTKQSKIYDLK